VAEQPQAPVLSKLPAVQPRRRRGLIAGAAVALAVVVVAVLQGVYASSPYPHPLSVENTEHTFWDHRLALTSAPGAVSIVGGAFNPSAILAYAPNGNLSSTKAIFAVVYRDVQDAKDASHASPTLLGGSLRSSRARNVLVHWHDGEHPRGLAKAIFDLRYQTYFRTDNGLPPSRTGT
jgi:hypothetical protein